MNTILEALPQLWRGTQFTLLLTFLAAGLGAMGAVVIGITRLSPYPTLRWAARVYVDFFRGTPCWPNC
jgi:arginine/lysine/histidine/glutamine transport system substrate-binding/permease protein